MPDGDSTPWRDREKSPMERAWMELAERLMQLSYAVALHRANLGLDPMFLPWDMRDTGLLTSSEAWTLSLSMFCEAWRHKDALGIAASRTAVDSESYCLTYNVTMIPGWLNADGSAEALLDHPVCGGFACALKRTVTNPDAIPFTNLTGALEATVYGADCGFVVFAYLMPDVNTVAVEVMSTLGTSLAYTEVGFDEVWYPMVAYMDGQEAVVRLAGEEVIRAVIPLDGSFPAPAEPHALLASSNGSNPSNVGDTASTFFFIDGLAYLGVGGWVNVDNPTVLSVAVFGGPHEGFMSGASVDVTADFNLPAVGGTTATVTPIAPEAITYPDDYSLLEAWLTLAEAVVYPHLGAL